MSNPAPMIAPPAAVEPSAEANVVRRRPRGLLFTAVFALIATGMVVRTVALDNPALLFHATRQYRSAIIARALYQRMAANTTRAEKKCARVALESQGELEPPLTESAAALGYVLLGHESLVIPRLLTSGFWMIGALALFWLARGIFSDAAAWVAACVFSFLPYGIVASRSFQPDPLMIMLLVTSVTALYRISPGDRPWRVLGTALVIAAAVFAKPYSGLLIGPAFAARALTCARLGAWLRWPGTWALLLIGFLLPTGYYALAAYRGELGGQVGLSFQPALWSSSSYYQGWRDMLEHVFGWPTLGLAALGVLLAPNRRAQVLLGALVLGYLAYGLAFAYHISTHDYYQLPLIPIVALGWAALTQRVLEQSRHRGFGGLRPLLIAAGLAVLARTAFVVFDDVFEQLRERRDGVNAVYARVGELVGHSCRVVFIASDCYGEPLQYHGNLSGWAWPVRRDLLARASATHVAPPAARDKLRAYRKHGAEYFVTTAPVELRRQRDLGRQLAHKYRLFASSENYVIYDLRAARD